jgi:hypothetical protein
VSCPISSKVSGPLNGRGFQGVLRSRVGVKQIDIYKSPTSPVILCALRDQKASDLLAGYHGSRRIEAQYLTITISDALPSLRRERPTQNRRDPAAQWRHSLALDVRVCVRTRFPTTRWNDKRRQKEGTSPEGTTRLLTQVTTLLLLCLERAFFPGTGSPPPPHPTCTVCRGPVLLSRPS